MSSTKIRHKSGDGDWICPDTKCGNLNFARRNSCNRCGKEKETISDSKRKKQGIEIGKAAAEKSHGLFSADDWQCTKCGNVNWARRQTCNMCNAPKVGEVEERTGYGGGFNEREGVEYLRREDSDDEFDEFGRRKKKFRGAPSQEVKKKSPPAPQLPPPTPPPLPPPPPPPPPPVVEDEDEDDESEDEDEGDLSKYDIWGADDEDEQQEVQGKNSETRSRSHSRSSSSSSGSSSDSSPGPRGGKRSRSPEDGGRGGARASSQ